jgi:hypothetical protein
MLLPAATERLVQGYQVLQLSVVTASITVRGLLNMTAIAVYEAQVCAAAEG